MNDKSPRQSVFISHATPDDNAFTLWLGGKLSALGYDVWADIFRLKGGDDWERLLEEAIRIKAAKVLVVANSVSVAKQGVRNEIKIAVSTGNKVKDDAFVIPLRMGDYDSPYLVVYAQYIDFKASWAAGLKALVETLEASGVPRPGKTERTPFWTELQLGQSRELSEGPETLVSNWLAIRTLPAELRVYDFAAGIAIGAKEHAVKSCLLPLAPFGRGFLSFALQPQLQEHFGEGLPLKLIGILETEEFIARGSPPMKIAAVDARRYIVDLLRRGIERHLGQKGLQRTELANDRRMWWPDKSLIGTDQKVFAWPSGPSGRRQLLGQSRARNVFWHYGISCWPAIAPLLHLRISGHVVFTLDGRRAVGDARRMHTMRRTLCRSWRNDRWRDLLLAFLYWLGDGASEIQVDLGGGAVMVIGLPPIQFEAGFGLGPAPARAAAVDDHRGDGEGADAGGLAGDDDNDDDPLASSDEPLDEDEADEGDAAPDEEER